MVLNHSDPIAFLRDIRGKLCPKLVRLAETGLGHKAGNELCGLLIFANTYPPGQPPSLLLAVFTVALVEERRRKLAFDIAEAARKKYNIEIKLDPFSCESGDICASFADENSLKERLSSMPEISAFQIKSDPNTIPSFIERRFGGRYPGWLNFTAMLACIGLLTGVLVFFTASSPWGAAVYLISLGVFVYIGYIAADHSRIKW